MAAAAEPYIFTRDYIDNNRINLGHYQWKELFGYLLHPSIPTNSEDGPIRVADVATGTSIWLLDLSSRLPECAQLDGLDISFQATPPPEWLPKNVQLKKWNVKDPVPEDLVGRYDIVHVRYLCLVLSDEEIAFVLQNVTRLLKPGGYLQWGEADINSWRIEKTRPDNEVSALQSLYELESSQDARFRPNWVARLPDLFQAAGLQNVQKDVRDPPGYLAFEMHETMLLLHELVVRSTGNKEIAKAVDSLFDRALSEGKNGACWAFTRWTTVGRKPIHP